MSAGSTLELQAQIQQGDCVQGMRQLRSGSVQLAFADPPFNIGYDYDVYVDRLDSDSYLKWTREWISEVHRVLDPQGTFWLAIGDEYAAEMKIIAQRVGFSCRSWVIWYYTFGVNCKKKFSRSHAHLFHFVKDPKSFTFNDDAIRVPSARQLVYGDGRANPEGRLPDDTWILRPQDLVDGLTPDEDTWYFPRVAGTFKERAGFHGCQMPEQLLGRIIRCCSNPGDLILDPFSGSATTLVVAKKLGRSSQGFELSEDYAARGQCRLDAVLPGDPLEGAAEPLVSAPKTPEKVQGKRARKSQVDGRSQSLLLTTSDASSNSPTSLSDVHSIADMPAGWQQAMIEAFGRINQGFSPDRIVADPEMNAHFIESCRSQGVPGSPSLLNQLLFRLRKSGKLADIPTSSRTEYKWSDIDPFLFASEIAWRQMIDLGAPSLDAILCDPDLAQQFDRKAAALAPGYDPLLYRWGALKLRKEANSARKRSEILPELSTKRTISIDDWKDQKIDEAPGIYWLQARKRRGIYVGATLNLKARFQCHFQMKAARESWKELAGREDVTFGFHRFANDSALVNLASSQLIRHLVGYQSRMITELDTVLNCPLLAGA